MSPRGPVSRALKGRGARSNASGRFESLARADFDDGWEGEPPAERLDEVRTPEAARSVLSRNTSPDIGFNLSVNPYQGCAHGCVYCYARPSHAYWGLSAGQDFERRIFYKPDAAARLAEALSRPRYVCEPIHIGGNTDPYQPAEADLAITRGVLETLERFRHPLSIITKSNRVLRDADLLGRLAADGLAVAAISLTTLDRTLARDLEPRAPTPARRLEAVAGLAKAGVPVRVLFAPVIPGLNDHELEAVVRAAAEAGAADVGHTLIRLPGEVRDLFVEWLSQVRPARAARVMSLIRQARGGRDNDPRFGARMRGEGPLAELIAQRMRAARRRSGFPGIAPLRRDLFSPPGRAGAQGDLFEGLTEAPAPSPGVRWF